ncbi:secreted RxLR effector protein 161-like [Hevea brasiliensis]|uniref:secreted RxLR effector protein 161-like n=1 Tax=Hevea brasiliensis TaxID=3981 RepID=UPI0025ED89D6|nr:secreted RxLR effector protein 161-like [Hevea brasiliensis]
MGVNYSTKRKEATWSQVGVQDKVSYYWSFLLLLKPLENIPNGCQFLGIKVKQINGGIFISQRKYAQDVLKKFKMETCKLILTPVEGRSKLAKDCSGDLQFHRQAAKRILSYIKGTLDDDTFYSSTNSIEFVSYTDSDWAGDIERRKSTSGYVFFFFSSGAFSWSSKKQEVVALSTAEAKYIVAASYATQAIWLQKMLSELQDQ